MAVLNKDVLIILEKLVSDKNRTYWQKLKGNHFIRVYLWINFGVLERLVFYIVIQVFDLIIFLWVIVRDGNDSIDSASVLRARASRSGPSR